MLGHRRGIARKSTQAPGRRERACAARRMCPGVMGTRRPTRGGRLNATTFHTTRLPASSRRKCVPVSTPRVIFCSPDAPLRRAPDARDVLQPDHRVAAPFGSDKAHRELSRRGGGGPRGGWVRFHPRRCALHVARLDGRVARARRGASPAPCAVFGILGSLLPFFAVGWANKLGTPSVSRTGASVSGLQSLQAYARGERAGAGAREGDADLSGTPLKPCSSSDQGPPGGPGAGPARGVPTTPGTTRCADATPRVRSEPPPATEILTSRLHRFQHPSLRASEESIFYRRFSGCIPSDFFHRLSARTSQVCVTMDEEFLASSAAHDGNDLSSVVAHGERWCVCAWAWASAVERDPARTEGLRLECEESNAKLRGCTRAHRQGEGMTGPTGQAYGPTQALEAVNRLCPAPASAGARLGGARRARRRPTRARRWGAVLKSEFFCHHST